MKIYLNTDWEIHEFHKISEEFLSDFQEDDIYIKMSTLNKEKDVDVFISQVASNDTVMFYNFGSLYLTICEFKSIYDRLTKKGVQVSFLHEKEYFIPMLLEIAEHESNLQSFRVKRALKLSREEGKSLGRPKIQDDTQQKIYYLYTTKKYTMRQIASESNVSLGTVSKYVSKIREEEEKS